MIKLLLLIIPWIISAILLFLLIKERNKSDNQSEALATLLKKDMADNAVLKDERQLSNIDKYLTMLKKYYLVYLKTNRLTVTDRQNIMRSTINIIPIIDDIIPFEATFIADKNLKALMDDFINAYNSYSRENPESLKDIVNIAIALSELKTR